MPRKQKSNENTFSWPRISNLIDLARSGNINARIDLLDFFFSNDILPLRKDWDISNIFIPLVESSKIILSDKNPRDLEILKNPAMAHIAMESGIKITNPEILSDPELAESFIECFREDLPSQVPDSTYYAKTEYNLTDFDDFWFTEYIPEIQTPLILLAYFGISSQRTLKLTMLAERTIRKSCIMLYSIHGVRVSDSYEDLSIRFGDKTTVAHNLAKKGHNFQSKNILSLRDCDGNTVAHIMAKIGKRFEDSEILNLKNLKNDSVKDVYLEAIDKAAKLIFS